MKKDDASYQKQKERSVTEINQWWDTFFDEDNVTLKE